MNKDEALKMAIEALKDADKGYAVIGEYDELIQACKEALEQPTQRNFCERCGKRASEDPYHIHTCTPPQALEQPAQEPAYQVGEIVNPYGSNIKIKQPAQEPVAWMHRHAGEITEFNDFQSCQYCEPLYTHPAPSWQGLSDEEVTDLTNFWNISDIGIEPFIDKVVRKLKEKNNVS